jgi:hypothetical protein
MGILYAICGFFHPAYHTDLRSAGGYGVCPSAAGDISFEAGPLEAEATAPLVLFVDVVSSGGVGEHSLLYAYTIVNFDGTGMHFVYHCTCLFYAVCSCTFFSFIPLL